MNTNDNTRQSLCCVCGKRLSAKKSDGNIQWEPSHAGEKGLFCDTCFHPHENEEQGEIEITVQGET